MARRNPHEAPVGDYAERPLTEALADPDEIKALEDRQPDQIEDYHEKHPTLAHNPKIDTAREKVLDETPGDADS